MSLIALPISIPACRLPPGLLKNTIALSALIAAFANSRSSPNQNLAIDISDLLPLEIGFFRLDGGGVGKYRYFTKDPKWTRLTRHE